MKKTAHSKEMALIEKITESLNAESLMPNDQDIASKTITQLNDAINFFNSQLTPQVANMRKELTSLSESITKTLEKFDGLSPQTKIMLAETADGSIGKITIPLREFLKNTDETLSQAKDLPNKSENSQLRALSLNVALIMRDTMGVKPTSTRDHTDNDVGAKNGAAFARLLKKIIFLVDMTPPLNLGPLLDNALDDIKNPKGEVL